MIQRAANDRGGESGVANVHTAMFLGDFRDSLNVCDLQRGVSRTFAEDQLRVRFDRSADVVEVAEINKIELHSERFELFSADPVCSAIRAVGDYTMVSSFHESGHNQSGC